MADTFNRYTSGGGRPVDDMGSTTPDIELGGSERPPVALVPAPYLPAGRFDEHKRANIVLSAGTPVALDAAGSMVPAGTPVGHTFTYSAYDATTGLPATKAAADGTAVTGAGVSTMASGLGGDRLGFFLQPVGVASYNVYQFEGSVGGTWPSYTVDYDNPANFPIHNTQAQPETLNAITCDYTLNVPYIWGRNLLSDTVKMIDDANVSVLSSNAKSYPFAHDELVVDTASAETTAVLGSGIKVVFVSPKVGLGYTGASGLGAIAGSVSGMTFAAPGGSAGSAVDATAAGYHILYDGTTTSKYVVIKTAGDDSVDSGTQGAGYSAGNLKFKLADTLQPGDYVACRLGKFVKFDSDRMEEGDKAGQVLRVRSSEVNRDYLKRVKTAFDRSADVRHRMAGSATRGVPYLHHLVTDGAQVILETKKTLAGTAVADSGSLPSSLPIGGIVINLLR